MIRVRKRNKVTGKGVSAMSDADAWYPVAKYERTQFRNNVKVSEYDYVRIIVSATGNYTAGVWSPDSSRQYNRVVG